MGPDMITTLLEWTKKVNRADAESVAETAEFMADLRRLAETEGGIYARSLLEIERLQARLKMTKEYYRDTVGF